MATSNIKFIAIANCNKGGESYKNVKEHYDVILNPDNKAIELQEVYDYYKNPENKTNNLVTISEDKNISISTILGLNNNFVKKNGETFDSNLRILYISPNPNISNQIENSLNNKIVSYSMDILEEEDEERPVTHSMPIDPKQIIYFGLDKNINDDELVKLQELEIEYYDINNIRKKGIKPILNLILNKFADKPILCVIDLEAIDKKIAPCVNFSTENFNGFNYDEINEISKLLQNKVQYLDITNFNDSIDLDDKEKSGIRTKMTSEVCRIFIKHIFDIKEKKINIFTEDSRFLIYRPEFVEDEDGDIGWYILRFLELEQKEQLLKHLEEDSIVHLDVEDIGGVYITATTMNEQNEKCYYTSNITDCCLFPQEKFLMAFELLN